MSLYKIYTALFLFAFTASASAQKIKPNKSEKLIKRAINSKAPSFYKDDLLINKITEEVIDGKFIRLDSASYHYDNNEHLDSIVFFKWKDDAWMKFQKSFYKYHSNGVRLEYFYQIYKSNNWFSQRKWEYTYDNNFNQTVQEQFRWAGGKWHINNQNRYTYDSNNLLTEIIWRNFSSDKWNDGYLDKYTYDTNKRLIERYTQTRLFSPNNEWMNLKKTSYTRNPNGKVLETEEIIWANEQWVPFKKTINEYDHHGNVVLEIEQKSPDSINYQNYTKEEFQFNKENLLTNVYSSEWKDNKWTFTLSRTYEYDDRQNQKYMLAKKWSSTKSEWVDNHQIFYNFQLSNPPSNKPTTELNFSVSPNPNDGKFRIELDERQSEKVKIKIYSLEGKFVGQYSIEAHEKESNLDLSHLNNGTYILSITLKDAVGRQKIVIQK